MRRLSQAISEGDGISVVVPVDGPEPARAAEEQGAEALALHPLAPRAGLREVARQLAAVKVERFALT